MPRCRGGGRGCCVLLGNPRVSATCGSRVSGWAWGSLGLHQNGGFRSKDVDFHRENNVFPDVFSNNLNHWNDTATGAQADLGSLLLTWTILQACNYVGGQYSSWWPNIEFSLTLSHLNRTVVPNPQRCFVWHDIPGRTQGTRSLLLHSAWLWSGSSWWGTILWVNKTDYLMSYSTCFNLTATFVDDSCADRVPSRSQEGGLGDIYIFLSSNF